jgi:NADPH:quinone reductase-like Zn-dependent oxidoreductase
MSETSVATPTSDQRGRAVRFDGYGDVDRLHVLEVPVPPPAAGEVLVRVRAAGINPGEDKIRAGELADRFPATFPSGEGSDLAGVVSAVGAEVADWAVGDEVIGWSDRRSSHAEFVSVPADQLVRRPNGLPWEVAGSVYVVGATAWAGVEALHVREGETVVVSAAAGGVGILAVQLLRRAGARVIGIASERNADFLRSLGVEPVAYGGGLLERLRAAAPDGVDAFFDGYGPDYVQLALQLGVERGRINTIADFAAVGREHVLSVGNAQGASAEVIGRVAELLASGELVLPIAATFPLEQVREAYRLLAGRHELGKIVLLP